MIVNCKNCNIEFEKANKDIARSKNHFCSRSCAAKYSNTRFPKRKSIHTSGSCGCGGQKDYKSKTCHECFVKAVHLRVGKKTIGKVLGTGASRAKHNQVRYLARRTMELSGQMKKCNYCDFTDVVEVCHRKAISSFALTDLISTVNSIDNLIYLCPNHHALLDRGIGIV